MIYPNSKTLFLPADRPQVEAEYLGPEGYTFKGFYDNNAGRWLVYEDADGRTWKLGAYQQNVEGKKQVFLNEIFSLPLTFVPYENSSIKAA